MIELQNETQTAEFTTTNVNWNSIPQMNFIFLKTQQNWLNDRLFNQGHVFLNEVFDVLGLPKTSDGAVSGWLTSGHGHIDFGIDSAVDDFLKQCLSNPETPIRLVFNIDGIIYDKI